MALSKIDVLALGRGNLTNNADATIVFTANNNVETWQVGSTYAQYNVVEHSGKIYRSKVAGNIGNQPDLSPNQWETLYGGVKDGDICFVVSGTTSTVLQRVNSIWSSVTGAVLTVALNDGQVSPADAIVFISTSKAFAKFEYTIRRGTGQGRKRRGELNILSDTAGAVEYSHEFNEIGSDVNVNLSIVAVGPTTKIQYTSAAEAVAIEMKYSLTRNWT